MNSRQEREEILVKNIFNNIKAYFVNINRHKKITTQKSIFVVLDTETTGLDVNEGHRIVSIAATKIKNLKITNEILDELVNPECQISERSIEIHHITQEQVENKPALKELDNKIYNFLEDTVLVGHNLNFDIKFIIKSAPYTTIAHRVKNIVTIDTIYLAAGIYPHFKSYELSFLCENLKIQTEDQTRHSALGDSVITARLFLHLLEEASKKNVTTIGGILHLCQQGKQIQILMKDLNKIH
ncbi:DnaQ DNA polymerase III, epsilon subunit and related 3'-5' exonucleases [Candidatus Pelagibacterales bacterium]